jgi:hypothetical protein
MLFADKNTKNGSKPSLLRVLTKEFRSFALLTKPYSVRDLSRALHKARALLAFAREKHLGM